MKKDCDRQLPCSCCTVASMDVERSYPEDNGGGRQGGKGWAANLPNHTKVKSRVMVDYELPEGDDRLDWDTDLVRRLYGEIS
jgi:hypothetical protein